MHFQDPKCTYNNQYYKGEDEDEGVREEDSTSRIRLTKKSILVYAY